MSSNNDILSSIPNNRPVRIFLPILGKKERYRINGLFEISSPPNFILLFKAGAIPVDLIDTVPNCIITVDLGGPSISLEAKIVQVVNDQKLEMALQKSINHEQMRDFFRVDAITNVIGSSFQPEFFGPVEHPWTLSGTTIDISGSGILATFTSKPPMDRQVRLEIVLPNEQHEKISVIARPVRFTEIHQNLFEVAYRFDDIAPIDRDKIIGCCLVIQRQMLRLKTQI